MNLSEHNDKLPLCLTGSLSIIAAAADTDDTSDELRLLHSLRAACACLAILLSC